MDKLLADRLNLLNKQNDKLKQAEGEFLLLDAEKDSFKATLFLVSMGESVKEREAKAMASSEYSSFMKALAEKENAFHHERRRYSILENAFYAELSTFKNEMQLIKKEGINT